MRYFLGFDGGGTKTECVLLNSADQVLARTYGGASNPSRIGVARAARGVEESAELALREVELKRSAITAIGAGLAGTAKAEMREQMRAALQRSFPEAAITMLTDLEAALAAAGEGPAIILVAGTGSAAFGRNAEGEIARAGGYGPAGSDQGSAFDIGRRGIALAMRQRAGGEDSPLGTLILAQLGCTEWSVVQHRAQTMPDEIYPPIFPLIAAVADAGDAGTQEILRNAAREVVSLVVEVEKRLGLGEREFLLAKMGGTVGRSRFFDAEIDAALQRAVPNGRIGKLRISPAEAAALAAKDANGG